MNTTKSSDPSTPKSEQTQKKKNIKSLYKKFKLQSFDLRKKEADKIIKKYPDRIPIILGINDSNDLPELDRFKYLVPKDITIAHFMATIRSRIILDSTMGIYFLINGTLPKTSDIIGAIYEQHKSNDGFLYVTYCKEFTFG